MDEYNILLETIVNMLREKNCQSFAVKSNKKDVEVKIGGDVVSAIQIEVNLENPDCEITVEKREKYYLLFI